ncbi:MAG: PP2C family protein-serine/threonine phosphatase [Candidatus Babeliales bacterium]|nr:PP2C family protein-serine/threonine phosphatase [Candidatus Babeliales bacterium]
MVNKNLFIMLLVVNLSLNAADPVPVNQLPYVVFSDPGTNDYMQDRSCAVVEDGHAFFGVFDGHGSTENGHLVAEFASKNLYANIMKHKMKKGFEHTDAQMRNEIDKDVIGKNGSTASVALIKDNKIYIGHVGDSKIVLVKKKGKNVIELTHDHNTNPEKNDFEFKRIQKLAADNNIDFEDVSCFLNNKWFVSNGNNMLSMSRAFGDKEYSPYIIAEPEAHYREITDEDEFLVLATDGLWDTLIIPSDNETKQRQLNYVGAFLRSKENWQDGAKALFNYALECWATSKNGSDNIEIVVVNLKLLKEQQAVKDIKELNGLMRNINCSQESK